MAHKLGDDIERWPRQHRFHHALDQAIPELELPLESNADGVGGSGALERAVIGGEPGIAVRRREIELGT